MSDKPVIECARSPSGRHRLALDVQVSRLEHGTELYFWCITCGAIGRTFLEDAAIRWDDAQRLPD